MTMTTKPASTTTKDFGSPPPLAVRMVYGRGYQDPSWGPASTNRRILPSVTTVLGCLAKPALEAWKTKQIGLRAVEDVERLSALVEDSGQERALRWLTAAPGEVSSAAAAVGTAAHAAVERRVRAAMAAAGTPDLFGFGGEVTELAPKPTPEALADDIEPRLEAFERFCAGWKPRWLGAELTVFHRGAGYAGTLDALAGITTTGDVTTGNVTTGNVTAVVDWKSGGAFDVAAMQVAALANAEVVVAPDGQEVPLPEVGIGYVVQLGADGRCLVRPVDTSRHGAPCRAFRHLLAVWYLTHGAEGALLSLPVPAPMVGVASMVGVPAQQYH